MADVIRANLLAIAAFDFYATLRARDAAIAFAASQEAPATAEVGPTQYPFDVMLGSRLLRHLTWH